MSKFKYCSLFQKGDRIMFTQDEDPDGEISYGELGTVREIGDYVDSLGVEWDKHSDARHDLGGSCDYGYGWWVPANMVEKLGAGPGISISDSDLESLLRGGF